MAAGIWTDVIRDALLEINIGAPDQPIGSENADWGKSKLNRLLDSMKAERLFAFQILEINLPITTAKDAYTIGLSGGGDFAYDRPVKIERANWVLPGGTPTVQKNLNIITFEAQADLSVPALRSGIPNTLYYRPNYPDGDLILYPVPNALGTLQIWVWGQISEVDDVSTTVSLPPAYRDLIIYNLAESMLGLYSNSTAKEFVREMARKARTRVKSLNEKLPSIDTMDSGVPSSNGRNKFGTFNYLTGNL